MKIKTPITTPTAGLQFDTWRFGTPLSFNADPVCDLVSPALMKVPLVLNTLYLHEPRFEYLFKLVIANCKFQPLDILNLSYGNGFGGNWTQPVKTDTLARALITPEVIAGHDPIILRPEGAPEWTPAYFAYPDAWS